MVEKAPSLARTFAIMDQMVPLIMSSAGNLEAGGKNILASCYNQVSYLVLHLTCGNQFSRSRRAKDRPIFVEIAEAIARDE
jgi:hypothetical protein